MWSIFKTKGVVGAAGMYGENLGVQKQEPSLPTVECFHAGIFTVYLFKYVPFQRRMLSCNPELGHPRASDWAPSLRALQTEPLTQESSGASPDLGYGGAKARASEGSQMGSTLSPETRRYCRTQVRKGEAGWDLAPAGQRGCEHGAARTLGQKPRTFCRWRMRTTTDTAEGRKEAEGRKGQREWGEAPGNTITRKAAPTTT